MSYGEVFCQKGEHDCAQDCGKNGVENTFNNVGGANKPIIRADHFHDGDFFFTTANSHLEGVDDDEGAAENECKN